MRRALTALAIAAFAGVPFCVHAASAGVGEGAKAGAHLAETVCSTCHATGDDKSKHSPDPQAPRFVDVAAMPSTTELSIKVFLRSSHRNMPNLMLTEAESASMAAYILGLRKQ